MIYFIFAILLALIALLLVNQEKFYKNKYYKKYFKNKYFPKIVTDTTTFHCARLTSGDEELVATPFLLDLYHYIAHSTLGFDIYIYRWKDFEELAKFNSITIKDGTGKQYQEYCDEMFQKYITEVYLPSI